MPKKTTVKISWTKEKALLMAAIASETVTDMTGNTDFTTPAVPLVDMKAAAELVQSTYNSKDNGPQAKLAYDNAVTDLDNKMYEQADYVSRIADGNATMIAGAGFIPTSNVRNAATRPDAPSLSKLTALGGGSVKSMVNTVIGATDYTHIFYTDANSTITVNLNQIIMSSATGGKFYVLTGGHIEEASNLAELTKINVIVVAHNAAGYSLPSGVAVIGVL